MLFFNNYTYAGIGSRETPKSVLQMMTYTASILAPKFTLYSGGADGADSAFERGAGKNKEIFLPWAGFRGNKDGHVPPAVPEYVEKYHPAPHRLSQQGWDFMSRNTYQVLGPDLKSPVDFLLCWTVDGKMKGGTAQAMRIAKDHNIPIFNFCTDMEAIKDLLIRVKQL